MRSSTRLFLLLACASSLFAAKNGEQLLTEGDLKIELIPFEKIEEFKDFDQQYLRPRKPYRLLGLFYDKHKQEREILRVIYHIAHPTQIISLKHEHGEEGYPKTLNYYAQQGFLMLLTAAGRDIYLSALANFARILPTKKVEVFVYGHDGMLEYTAEKMPQPQRLTLWRMLAKNIAFTSEFAGTTDTKKIKKIFKHTLFSILCRDREEAAQLVAATRAGPLKIYLDTVLLQRPTALESLAQALNELYVGAVRTSAKKAAAALAVTSFMRELKKAGFKKPTLEQLRQEIPGGLAFAVAGGNAAMIWQNWIAPLLTGTGAGTGTGGKIELPPFSMHELTLPMPEGGGKHKIIYPLG
ncbi:MAG: hypothetical protein M1549_02980 [Candidatus Dependentiae bacterium]|nr:hypothetical protein [Candidatus Dependentiae bacterium]